MARAARFRSRTPANTIRLGLTSRSSQTPTVGCNGHHPLYPTPPMMPQVFDAHAILAHLTADTIIADTGYIGRGLIGVLWVLWTLLKNGISRLLSGVGSILGGRGWGFGTLTPSEVVSDCNVTRSRLSHPL